MTHPILPSMTPSRRTLARLVLTHSTGETALPPPQHRPLPDDAVRTAFGRAWRTTCRHELEGTLPEGGCLLWANHSGGAWPTELALAWTALPRPARVLGGPGSWSPDLDPLHLLPATWDGLQAALEGVPLLLLPGGPVDACLPDARRNWGRLAPQAGELLDWARQHALPVVPLATFATHHRRLGLPQVGGVYRSRLGRPMTTWAPDAVQQQLQDELEVLERRVRRQKVGKWVNK